MLRLSLIILAVSSSVLAQAVDTSLWLEDFTQLKQEMSAHYANLEWAVAERGVDLKTLSAATEDKLRAAKTEAEAKLAIQSFLQAFGDGHLRVEWSASKSGGEPSPRPAKICERLGFREWKLRPGVDFGSDKSFTQMEIARSKFIAAGVGTLANGKRFGVVRIPIFVEQSFPALCDAALAEMNLAPDAACDDECEGRVRQKASDLYSAALATQVEGLNKEKIDLLVVDLTGNGGGNDVYDPMARMLTSKPLRTPASGFIRHPHWAKIHKERLADILAALPRAPRPMRERLKTAETAMRHDLAEAEKPCDLTPLWRNEKVNCSNVVAADKAGIAYARPGELSNSVLGEIYFNASRYRYTEGLYTGPLVVLIDERTASASEAFASMLRDNGAATIIGAPSYGAGCGYTDGGIPTRLKNSKAAVHMPDCVRFRLDGTNEINGVTPDVLIPWRQNDTPVQRARRVKTVLETLVK